MTQTGKCDVCRSRKVKCDQGKPVCGSCLKGGRPCSYQSLQRANASERRGRNPSSDADSDIGLRLKSMRCADTGTGVYQTFAVQNLAHTIARPSTPLSNQTTFLVSKWIRMSDRMPTKFADGLTTRFGDDPALDAVVEYMCDCHYLFETHTEESIQITRRSGVKALQNLRIAISESDPDVSETMMTSVRLLLIAEYLRDTSSSNFIFHAFALSRMLKTRFTSGKRKWGATEELLVRTNVIEEAGDSILRNAISEMDDPKRIEVRNSAMKPSSPLDAAVIWITDNSYRIPRLVMMIRKLSEFPDDQALLESILTLARNMNETKPIRCIRELAEAGKSMYEAPSHPLGKCVAYPNDTGFGMAMWYYFYRLHICGIIQRIFQVVDTPLLPDVHAVFDLAAAEAEEVQAARHLAMSTEYALDPAVLHPFLALRMYSPMSISYGTWVRLEKRSIGKDDEVAALAVKMQDFVYETTVRIMQKLRTTTPKRDLFDQVSDAYFGGPALPWLSWRGRTKENTLA